MERFDKWIARAALLLCGMTLGWLLAGGHAVQAQSSTPQVEVRALAASDSMVVYYPDQQMVYVYTQPFVGLPDSYCSYKFKLSSPGGKITRQQCNGN